MILLDTNVVSDSSRPRPHLSVWKWFNAQRPTDLFICAPVLAELKYGIERLSEGVRRSFLERWLRSIEEEGFSDRILPFERRAAHEFGRFLHSRMTKGRPIKTMDVIVASIAKAEGATLATRDIDDFADLDLELINPFDFDAT